MIKRIIIIAGVICIFCSELFAQCSKKISYGFQLGMVAYETSWNAYTPSTIQPLRYTSMDLLPVPKIGLMSEYNFSKRWAVDFSPAITVHHTYMHGGTELAKNNGNLFTLRSIELPVVAKFYVPVADAVRWNMGAGIGFDFIPKKWQIKGPYSDSWDSSFEGGGPEPPTFFKEVTEQLLINHSIVPAVNLQTGLDIKLKNKGCFYVGVEGHFQTMKNFNLKRHESDYVANTSRFEVGPAFNTNYFLVKIGYWLRKK